MMARRIFIVDYYIYEMGHIYRPTKFTTPTGRMHQRTSALSNPLELGLPGKPDIPSLPRRDGGQLLGGGGFWKWVKRWCRHRSTDWTYLFRTPSSPRCYALQRCSSSRCVGIVWFIGGEFGVIRCSPGILCALRVRCC